jgi:hypothetical protein
LLVPIIRHSWIHFRSATPGPGAKGAEECSQG